MTLRYVERLVKFLLWQQGGCEVLIAGADDVTGQLAQTYSASGARSFDHGFMGETVYGRPFRIQAAEMAALPGEKTSGHAAR